MFQPEKSPIRCATTRCIESIAKYGEHYHSVQPGKGQSSDDSIQANCERCGGGWNGATWIHACKMCGKTVQPGELKGFFVPHRCVECDVKVIAKDKAAGNVCGRCKQVFSYCCC